MNFEEKKQALRHQLRYLRRQVPVTNRACAAQAASKLFINTEQFRQSQKIACYLSTAEEFDCQPIIQHIHAAGKKCYLPVLSSTKNENSLVFIKYSAGDALQPNHYGLMEPVNREESCEPSALDLVLLPLVGFDQAGYRLGMGGGFYDRTFHFKKDQAVSGCQLVGLAYALQKVDALPHASWDVKLDAVLTEKEWINFERKESNFP